MVSISKWKRTALFGVVFATAVVMTKIMMVTMIGMMVGSVHSETVTDDMLGDQDTGFFSPERSGDPTHR